MTCHQTDGVRRLRVQSFVLTLGLRLGSTSAVAESHRKTVYFTIYLSSVRVCVCARCFVAKNQIGEEVDGVVFFFGW